MEHNLENYPWWDYLEKDIQELIKEAYLLIDTVERWETEFSDYSFIVFPAAKGYEGFLKKLFLDIGVISERDFNGKHFRIGKALNPSLDRKRYKNESVYDKLNEYCGGEELANYLWQTWKTCRNKLFHWFPNKSQAITFDEAKVKVKRVVDSINLAFKDCKVEISK